MLVLQSKKISIREEVHNLLAIENKKIDDFKGLMDFLLRLEQSRADLRLTDEKWNKHFNPKTTIPHDKMEVYIRMLLNLNMYLTVQNRSGKSLLNFQYRSNMSKSWVRNNSLYFEAVMSFYNYAALYFNSGYNLLMTAKGPAEAKQSMIDFRIAFWGFQECYQGRRFCLSTGRMPDEISNNNLELLMALCVAFGYLNMSRAMGPMLGKLTATDRCKLYCSVGKHLMHAESLISKSSCKQFDNKSDLMGKIFWFKNLFYCKTFFEMAEEYRIKHEEKVTGGFIGWQIAYLRALKECFGNLSKCGKGLLKSQEQMIIEIQKLLKRLPSVELENSEVYKVNIPMKKDLILEEPKSKLKSLERPNCKTLEPELKKVFSNKKSQNFNRILADLNVVVNTNRNNLFGMIDRIVKKKNFIYQDTKIDSILSTVSNKSIKQIQAKLAQIKNEYGGYMGYMQLTENLRQISSKNDSTAKKIVSQMQRDRDSDFAFQRSTGVKIPALKESNPDLIKQFEKHGIGLTALKKKDRELIGDFEKYSETLRKAEEGAFEQELGSLSTGLGKIEGVDQLAKMDMVVNQWFNTKIEGKKKEILEYYKSLDLEEMVINIFFNRFSEEKTYLDLNDKLDSRTQEIQEHIEKQHTALNKISEVSNKVNGQLSGFQSQLDKKQRLISEINGAALLYSMLLNNLELHTNFESALALIEQSVNDIMTSKELQKQEIQNEKRGGQGGGGYFGTPQSTENKAKDQNSASAFLSDILKEQGFDFKF